MDAIARNRLGCAAMTTALPTAASAPNADTRVIGLVSAAHFISHYYILVLPPLFVFVRADFAVSYTELGAAIAVFNILSAALQTPAGFLVDRIGARSVLAGGLILGASALAMAAATRSFAVFVAMFALAGAGNAVYHPADYALLSGRVSAARMSGAYSVHIFAGFIGTAVAPATLLFFGEWLGWRGAFAVAALGGFAVAATVVLLGGPLGGRAAHAAEAARRAGGADWRILMSAPVLLNFAVFLLIATLNAAVQNYAVVALEALRGVSLATATTALSAFLLMSAFAVLAGGLLSARTERHDAVAMGGFAVCALSILTIAFVDVGAGALVALMGLAGFFLGLLMPARDMIVRAATPPGAFGKVFGFVTTGFNVAGIVAPPLFGWMMDSGYPRAILIVAGASGLLAIPTVLVTVARAARNRAAV
jgi:MFS family permease